MLAQNSSVAGGATEIRQRDVIDATGSLERVISELENRVTVLQEQLQAVLMPKMAEPASAPSGKIPQPSRSPLAEGLNTGVRRLETVLDLINDLLRRTQV
jgi:hypothetical protein